MKLFFRCFIAPIPYIFNATNTMAQPLRSVELLTSPLPIFSELQESGQMSGYSVEYARGVFELSGYQSSVTPLPFARLIRHMKDSELTVATGIGRTPEREDDYYWIAPMTANVIGIFSIVDESNAGSAKSTDKLKLSNLTQLDKAKSVAVLRGDYRAELLRTLQVKNIVEFNSWEQAIGAVLKGRVSSIFFSDLGISITCKLAGFDCDLLEKTYTYDVQFSYMAMQKTEQNREHAIKLANAAERFIRTTAFNQLVDDWLPKLQELEADVSVKEGVITLGELDDSQSFANQIWVLTHLEPPFSQYDERGNPSGYAVELVQGILTEAGLRQQILAAPWQRILVESALKSDVLVFSLARTPAREEDFHWISPITQNAYSVFGRKSDPQNSRINTLEQLPANSLIAVLAGDFREQVIIDAGHTAVATETWQIAFKKFLAGDADYLFFSDGGIDMMCLSINESCADVTRVFQYQLATTYLAVSKRGTSAQLVAKLKSAATNFKRSTQYQSMVNHWLPQFKLHNIPNIHEQDGMIKLWAKLAEQP